MNFQFWCKLPDGSLSKISTCNIFEAPRHARKLGAVACFGKNPSTGNIFSLNV